MHKKSFTFGIGTGILAMTLLLYFIYNIQISKYKESFEKDLAAQKEQLQNEFSEIEPQVKEAVIQLNDEEIIEKARQLGMAFPKNAEPLNENPIDMQSYEPPKADTEPDPAPASGSAEVLSETNSYVIIEIKEGNISSEIADVLYKGGVIKDTRSFNDFLNETGNTKNLAYGKFTIPKGLSYEEIFDIIKCK